MSLHDFKVKSIAGEDVDLSKFKGKKVMVVNTASECGLTPQYAQLEELYKSKGSQCEVIGFPCNDFGAQEPGTEAEIQTFCSKNYGVSFPMMAKVKVKGSDKHPLYDWLLSASSQKDQLGEVKWNFQKFLIDENGEHVKTLEPTVEPMDEEILNWINE